MRKHERLYLNLGAAKLETLHWFTDRCIFSVGEEGVPRLHSLFSQVEMKGARPLKEPMKHARQVITH
jgi:hypothetical protein